MVWHMENRSSHREMNETPYIQFTREILGNEAANEDLSSRYEFDHVPWTGVTLVPDPCDYEVVDAGYAPSAVSAMMGELAVQAVAMVDKALQSNGQPKPAR